MTKRVITMLLLILLAWTSALPASMASSASPEANPGTRDGSGLQPWFRLQGVSCVQSNYDLVVGGDTDELQVYNVRVYPELSHSIAVDEPILYLVGTGYGVAGLGSKGNLYILSSDRRSVKYKLPIASPASGDGWSESDLGPILHLKEGSYNTKGLAVKVGGRVHLVDPVKGSVTAIPAANAVEHFTVTQTTTLAVMPNDQGYVLKGYDMLGNELVSVSAANALPAPSVDGAKAFFLTPDRLSIRVVDLITGDLDPWTLPLEKAANAIEINGAVMLVDQGTEAFAYSIPGMRVLQEYQFENAGVLKLLRGAGPTQVRHVDSTGIHDYLDEQLAQTIPLPAGINHVRFSDTQIPVSLRDAEGNLFGYRSAAPLLRNATLSVGQGFIFTLDSYSGRAAIIFQKTNGPENVDLVYHLYQVDEASGEALTISLGSFSGQFDMVEIDNLPKGELYLALTPLPEEFDEETLAAGIPDPLQFSLTLVANISFITSLPPRLSITAPEVDREVWGDIGELAVSVKTDGDTAVLFGADPEPVYTESGYITHAVPLMEGFVQAIPVFAISRDGHATFATISAIKHWLAAKPTRRTLQNGKIVLSVPDASLIDLEHSYLVVGEVACTLGVDSASRLVGTPESELPDGELTAQLLLVAKGDDGSEPQVLDFLTWEVGGSVPRVAELWLGKNLGYIDGQAYPLEAAPYATSGRTMVPIRFVGDAMGAKIGWNSGTSQATFELEGKTVVLTIGSRTALVDGQVVTLDVAPRVLNGRTFVPLRFVTETLGAKVDWNGQTSKITLTVGN